MFILWDRDQNHHGNTENDTNSKFQESTHFDFTKFLLCIHSSGFYSCPCVLRSQLPLRGLHLYCTWLILESAKTAIQIKHMLKCLPKQEWLQANFQETSHIRNLLIPLRKPRFFIKDFSISSFSLKICIRKILCHKTFFSDQMKAKRQLGFWCN